VLVAAEPESSSPDVIGPLIDGLAKGFVAVWPLWLLIGAIAAAKFGFRLYELRRLSQSGIADVDRMDGTTFERFLTTLFQRLGYGVEHTGRRGDYGADLVVTKDGRRIAVQAKRWSKAIGVKAVQEAVASKGMYSCVEALVVANQTFTRQARTLAWANGVVLWDRDVLVDKLIAVRNGSTDTAVSATSARAVAEEIPPSAGVELSTRHCVRCDVAVSDKVRDYCLARPKQFGGRVYCFKHQPGALRATETP
jgi:restriction system protein